MWAKKSTALAGAPTQETSQYPDYTSAFAPVAEPEFQPWNGTGYLEEEAPAATENGIFSTIGVVDKRRPVGPQVRLPGALGKFMGGIIERHEYALALRGEKGAGKSRLQYQILNMLAALGMNCALFSLEIDKNSSVVQRYTEAYIAPANRARVQVASEAPGGLKAIKEAAAMFDVVAIDSWGKIEGTEAKDFDKIRKEFPACLFIVIFQSTSNGTARGGPAAEYDASAVCQVNLPGVAVMEKNRYAQGPADEFQYDVNKQTIVGA